MHRLDESAGLAYVELSPFEGVQLFTFLEELAKNPGPHCDVTTLAAIASRLGDANALAMWLRENVVVEMSLDEARAVLTALQTNGQTDRPKETQAALSTAASKLVAWRDEGRMADTTMADPQRWRRGKPK